MNYVPPSPDGWDTSRDLHFQEDDEDLAHMRAEHDMNKGPPDPMREQYEAELDEADYGHLPDLDVNAGDKYATLLTHENEAEDAEITNKRNRRISRAEQRKLEWEKAVKANPKLIEPTPNAVQIMEEEFQRLHREFPEKQMPIFSNTAAPPVWWTSTRTPTEEKEFAKRSQEKDYSILTGDSLNKYKESTATLTSGNDDLDPHALRKKDIELEEKLQRLEYKAKQDPVWAKSMGLEVHQDQLSDLHQEMQKRYQRWERNVRRDRSRSKSRHRSKSRDRHHSRSRDRHHDRHRSHSRHRDRDREMLLYSANLRTSIDGLGTLSKVSDTLDLHDNSTEYVIQGLFALTCFLLAVIGLKKFRSSHKPLHGVQQHLVAPPNFGPKVREVNYEERHFIRGELLQVCIV